jgi:cytidine deaminase
MSDYAAKLVAAAREASANAHAPYSGYGVGAAILLAGGEIITGCNFENASYGMTLCAETVALATTNAQGKLRDVREMAVIGGMLSEGKIGGSDIVYPCGRCRQIIHEAAQMSGTDIPIHCASGGGAAWETHLASALLPLAFGPANLGIR